MAAASGAAPTPASLQEALAVQQQQQRMQQLIAAGSNPRGAAPLTLSQQGSDSISVTVWWPQKLLLLPFSSARLVIGLELP